MLSAKQILIFIAQIFCCAVCFAQTQTIDSLKEILPYTKDTQQVNILNEIAELYFQETQDAYDSNLIRSREFADEALQLSRQIHYTRGSGIALSISGNVLSSNGYKEVDYHHAIAVFKEAISLLKEANENKELGNCLEILAETIHELGDNQQAIQYYDSSLAVFQKIKDTSGLILSLEWKGHSYFDLGDYKNAYAIGQSAYELAQKAKDTLAQILTADHLANLFLGADMPETVLEYMRIITRFYPSTYSKKEFSSWEIWWGLLKAGEAYLQLGEIDSAMEVAQVVSFYPGDEDQDMFLGHLYIAKDEYYKALPYFKDGFYLSSKSEHTISIARHANGLSRVYLAIGKYDSALYYANKAMLAASSIHALLEWKDAISTLTNIYDKTHNYTKAYQFSRLYKSLSDSLAPEEYKRKLALIEIQHQLESQKQQGELLAKENQLQVQQNAFEKDRAKRIQSIAIIVISAAVLIMAMIFIIIRLKRKKELLQKKQLYQELELQAAESKRAEADFKVRSFDLESQALRAQMNPHFIFNCLNSINRFIINNNAAKAADYLTKFARLIRIVLEQSGKSFITLEDEICWLKLYMALEALRFEKPFQYKIDLNGTDVSSVMIPTMLIQPFVENAIWHGLHPKQNGVGEIKINMHKHDSILQCSICDNGVGIKDSKQIIQTDKKSLGTQLTQQRLQLLNINHDALFKIKVEQIKNEDEQIAGTCVY